jgi:hypothetical protein
MESKITKENIATANYNKDLKDINENIEKGLKLQKLDTLSLKEDELLNFTNSLIINPNYQRDYRYSVKDESSIIESILVGIPIPPIFVAKSKMNSIHVLNVIDGQHRLRAINRFLNCNFSLNGLTLLPEYEGKSFDKFSTDDKMAFYGKKLSFIEFEKFPGLDIEVEIFNRYNKGTKPLTPQEIRHAVYNSKFNEYVNNFVNNLKNKDLDKIYNATVDRVQKKKLQESIFVILSILENGVNLKLEKSPEYAEAFMREKKQLANNETEFEKNFENIIFYFNEFNKFISKLGEKIKYPFSKELYGLISRNYKFQISIAMILAAICNIILKKYRTLNKINRDKFLKVISKYLMESYLEDPNYSASSTNPKKIEELLSTINIEEFIDK